MKYEQISFIKPIENAIKEPKIYDATICNRCCCDKCIYSVGIYPPLTKEELEIIKAEESCWNCDECYYYGMDDENLSKDIVTFECNKFKMSNYYVEQENRYMELEAKRRRKKFIYYPN